MSRMEGYNSYEHYKYMLGFRVKIETKTEIKI